jgi:hypothetical protein
MPKTFKPASAADRTLLDQVMREHHFRLRAAEVVVRLVMVSPNRDADGNVRGPAIKVHGAPAAACVRAFGPRERMLVGADAVIDVDAARWFDLERAQQIALLDHELTHLEVFEEEDEDGSPGYRRAAVDGCPVVRMRPDDFVISGFVEVIKRHGQAALEAQAVADVGRQVQIVFDFMKQLAETQASDEEMAEADRVATEVAADESSRT